MLSYPPLFHFSPYTTLFRSNFRFARIRKIPIHKSAQDFAPATADIFAEAIVGNEIADVRIWHEDHVTVEVYRIAAVTDRADRKSTRLNSSHTVISYAVFCLK